MFYGNSFLKYSASELIDKIVGYKTIIHLNLRAFRCVKANVNFNFNFLSFAVQMG